MKKGKENRCLVLLLCLFVVIDLFFLRSVIYMVFLLLMGITLTRKVPQPRLIMVINVLFSVIFYMGIYGCRCVYGQEAANAARLIFLLASATGLVMMMIKVIKRETFTPISATSLSVMVTPIVTMLLVNAYIKFYTIDGFVQYL